jgi:hypothetical protein
MSSSSSSSVPSHLLVAHTELHELPELACEQLPEGLGPAEQNAT